MSDFTNLSNQEIYIHPEEFGAIGDGKTNDTTALRKAIETGKIVLLSNKSYALNTTLVINNNTTIIGEAGATLLCNAAHGVSTNQFSTENFDISIINVTFKSDLSTALIDPGSNSGSLVRLFNCSHVYLTMCKFFDDSGKQMLWFRNNTKDIHITNCFFYKNSPTLKGASLSFWTSDSSNYIHDALIENCTLYHCSNDECLDVMAGGIIEGLLFNNCTFYNIENKENKQNFYLSIYPTTNTGIAKNIKFNNCNFSIHKLGILKHAFYIRNSFDNGGEVSHLAFNNCYFNADISYSFFCVTNYNTNSKMDLIINDCNVNLTNWFFIYDGSDIIIKNSIVQCSILARTYTSTAIGSLTLLGGVLTANDDYFIRVTKPSGEVYAKGCTIYTKGMYCFSSETYIYSGEISNSIFTILDCDIHAEKDNFSLFNCQNETSILVKNTHLTSEKSIYFLNNSNTKAKVQFTALFNTITCPNLLKISDWTPLSSVQIQNYFNTSLIIY